MVKKEEDAYREKIEVMIKHIKQKKNTAEQLARDDAEYMAENFMAKSEETIEEISSRYVSFRSWRSKAYAYGEVVEDLESLLYSQ
jgi:hypothetical protein